MTDGQHEIASGEDEIRAGVATAAPYQPPQDAEEKEDWPFRLTAKGVEKRVDRTDKETGAVTSEWRWFCSRLEVIAQSRTVEGEDWGRLLVISDGDRRVKAWAMPMSMLAGDGSEYRARLLSLGLIMAPGHNARNYLHEYIAMAQPKEKVRCVNRIGWHGSAFVLPDCTIGETCGERVVLQTGAKPDHPFQVQGGLQDWQNAVARPAVGNSRLVFALCAAFAAPLLYLIGAESGGFHFRGGEFDRQKHGLDHCRVGVGRGQSWAD